MFGTKIRLILILHQTVNIVVFFSKYDGNTYQKGRAILQMYRVVPQTKRENIGPVKISSLNAKHFCSNCYSIHLLFISLLGFSVRLNF